ncbi:hypothetical protein MNEG_13253 [Monoraphidium neglectum]|uniref:Uncharacterized protein n=1 Tax=Monoraphidium neglectum TaxID=145388 RepID=A0A0D2LSX3_9CHLO|nr:hypothetical protein MNEG_13253 [Monoraphidium neglectum]KIY94709.1 hypothetical protein MNEG_13253 [Monoraphidium neglectum]|eukprot:XP_013893729.1 hypothetical protein MNEG_13253 [Monoraphidium neglectum]
MGRLRKQGPQAVLKTAPAYSFGNIPTPPLTGDTGPGPGAYFTRKIVERPGGWSVVSTGTNAPATTIRVRPMDARAAAATPGPGDYEPRDELLRRSSPQFTIRGVDPKARHYTPERSDKLQHPAAPAVAITHKHPPPESYEKRPAPGEYSGAPGYRSKSPLLVTLKFRRPPPASQRPESGHAVPGPGQYPLRCSLGGPAYSMGRRLRRQGGGGSGGGARGADGAPGPGDYEIWDTTIGLAGRLAKSQ